MLTVGATARRGVLAAAVLAGLLAGPASLAASDADTTIDACDWTSFRNGPRNPGASGCDGIGAQNVATLAPRFLYRTRDSVTSTPAVVDGVVYVGAWDGSFYAFDADGSGLGDESLDETGISTVEPMWTRELGDPNTVAFGRIVSSPSVADVRGTRVVIVAAGATLYALRAATGDELAAICLDPRAIDRCQGSGSVEIEVESSPLVVPHPDGSVRVLIGLDVHNAAGVGRTGVVKLRLGRTGPAAWEFTPEWKFDPEAGEAYTGPDLLTRGAGTGEGCGGVWGTPAVDVAANVVVFGTSSCKTRSTSGTEHPGEDVIAVRYSDGSLRWTYRPPRRWGTRVDDDFGAAIQLFETSDGLLAGAGSKDGWYYAIVATGHEQGRLVWSTHVGQSGHLRNDFAIGGIIGSPAVGTAGGRQVIFITTAIPTPVGSPLDEPSDQVLDTSLAEDPSRLASLHALDATTGGVVWFQPLTRPTYGHPTYANGLVLVPSTVGLSVQAFDAATGLPRWSSPPLNGAPSSGVAVTNDAVFFGAGTRQTDAGFKLAEDVPPLKEHLGADPQERASGVWAFGIGG